MVLTQALLLLILVRLSALFRQWPQASAAAEHDVVGRFIKCTRQCRVRQTVVIGGTVSPLQAAAARLRSGSAENATLLRAILANMVCGLKRGEVDKNACGRKLDAAATAFLTGMRFEEDTLLAELIRVLETDQDGWYRRQPDLKSHLDLPLVAISDHLGLAAWMGQSGSLGYKDDGIAKDACRILSRLVRDARTGIAAAAADTRLNVTIGKPARPLWLTPMCDELQRIIALAETSPSSRLANDACGTLGLSHLDLGCPVEPARRDHRRGCEGGCGRRGRLGPARRLFRGTTWRAGYHLGRTRLRRSAISNGFRHRHGCPCW